MYINEYCRYACGRPAHAPPAIKEEAKISIYICIYIYVYIAIYIQLSI